MSRARVDLGGSSSRSSGKSSGGGENDPKKVMKIGGAIALFVIAGGVIAWQSGLFEAGPPKNDGVFQGADQPQATNTEGQPAAQPTEETNSNGYGDESTTAAAPPKRPERRGGGYVNPDAPKDPQ